MALNTDDREQQNKMETERDMGQRLRDAIQQLKSQGEKITPQAISEYLKTK